MTYYAVNGISKLTRLLLLLVSCAHVFAACEAGNRIQYPSSLRQFDENDKFDSSENSNEQKDFRIIDDQLNFYTEKVKKAFANHKDERGLLVSSTLLPFAGELIRRPINGGDAELCSGILIGSKFFLTAAHCACERGNVYWPSASDCLSHNAPAASSSIVYFPSVGAVHATKPPIISPQYNGADLEARTDKSLLGDLAIIELDSEIPIKPISFVKDVHAASYASFGYGVLDLTDKAEAQMNIPGGPYKAGIGVISFPKIVDCYYTTISDTICSNYNSYEPVAERPAAALCGGDSGGPLLAIASDGQVFLAGIASRRMSQRGEGVCGYKDAVQSIYTNVQIHIPWILSVIGKQEQTYGPTSKYCAETLLSWPANEIGRAAYREHSLQSIVTITASGFYRPETQVDLDIAPATICSSISPQTYSCVMNQGAELSLKVSGRGLLQLSTCSSR